MNTAWSKPTKYIVGVALGLLGIYVLYLSHSVIPLLIVAALLAVIVRPLVLWLHQHAHLPRGLAVLLVYLLVLVITPLAVTMAIPAIVDAVRYVINLDYQGTFQKIAEWLDNFLMSLKAAQLPVESLDAYVDETVDALIVWLQSATPATTLETPAPATIIQSLSSALTATFGVAASVIGSVFSSALLLIFIFLASIYINLSAHGYRDAFIQVVPEIYQSEIATLLARIERTWNAFFRGQLMLMLVIGTVSTIGLSALGLPGALSLGIIAGLLELIPNLGPIIATFPAVIVALLQGSNYLPVSHLTMALLVVIFYIMVQQLENTIIVPRVLGDAVELPPLVVMTGVLVGGQVAGILGTLLATPIIATMREILRYVYRKLQGQDPFPLAEVRGPHRRSTMLSRSWGKLAEARARRRNSAHGKQTIAADSGNEMDLGNGSDTKASQDD